jgi:hypothetical protein
MNLLRDAEHSLHANVVVRVTRNVDHAIVAVFLLCVSWVCVGRLGEDRGHQRSRAE